MEAALKEVFNVHRTVVRGLRLQLQQAFQEKNEIKQRMDQKYEQLETEVKNLREETCSLLNAVAEHNIQADKILREGRLCGCHKRSCWSDKHKQTASPLHTPLMTSPAATQLLEERLHIVEQMLADVVQQRKQMMHSRKSQPILGPSASKVNGGRHSESVDSMKEVQQIREQNGDPKSSQHPSTHSIEEDAPKQQQLPKTMSKRGDSMLEGHRLGGCTVQTGAGLPASTSMQPFSSCQPAPVELPHQLGACQCATSTSMQHTNCGTDMDAGVMAIDGKTSSKTCPPEKSPELGPKLQLARNTAKRRRYTEDEVRRKGMKWSTEGRVSVIDAKPSQQQHRSLCDSNTTGRWPCDTVEPLQTAQSPPRPGCSKGKKARDAEANSNSVPDTNISAAASGPGLACGSSPTCLVSDTCLPSPVKSKSNDKIPSAGTVSNVVIVPETLGVDLTGRRGEEEGHEESVHSALPHSTSAIDDSNCKVQGQVQADPGTDSVHSASHGDFAHSTSHSTGASKQQLCGESREGIYELQNKKTTRYRSLQLSEGAQKKLATWQTDSIVFGNTRPSYTDHWVQQAGGTGSTCIVGEEAAACDRQSPVFTKHRCDTTFNDQSPALFDEEECELDPAPRPVGCLATPVSDSGRAPPLTTTASPATPLFVWMAETVNSSPPAVLKTELTEPSLQLPLHVTAQAGSPGAQSSQQSQALLAPTYLIANSQSAALAINGSSTNWMGTSHPGSSGASGIIMSDANLTEMDPAGVSHTDKEECVKSVDGEHIKAAFLDGCGDDNYQDVTLDPSFQRAHEMCGQDITVISQNDTEVNLTSQQIQTPHAHTPRISRMAALDDSFDRVPQKNGPDSYAFVEVVRKRRERRQLKGFSCQECKQYYSAVGRSESEVEGRMAQCSRHRARQAPPSTPEHFWSVGFPDSQQCEQYQTAGSEQAGKGPSTETD